MSGTTHFFGDGHAHGPCPTCGHDFAAAPAAPVTSEMTEAMWTAWVRRKHMSDLPEREDMHWMLVAALAAAPLPTSFGGWVWCDLLERPARPIHQPVFGPDPCPGPHRTLHLGPEDGHTEGHTDTPKDDR